MHDLPIITKRYKTRSFTSIYDILSPTPLKDVYRLGSQNIRNTVPVFQVNCTSKYKNSFDFQDSVRFNETPYITSENYHALNKNTSNKSVIRSTSTLFYDLDKIAKRHSYHCMPEGPAPKSKKKTKADKSNKSGFGAKSEAIVQECETQMLPKLKIRDSIQTNSKKVKRTCAYEPTLSSEIFLKDDYINKKSNSYEPEKDTQNSKRQQKFWSYAKYRTEYSNPITEKKKCSKKDRGKRTEDPCPCQLFSYACPCTDKKSLTELAKSSKTLTVAEQITGTSKLFLAEDQGHKQSKQKQSRGNDYYDDKPRNTDIMEYTNNYEIVAASEGQILEVTEKNGSPKVIDNNSYIKNNSKNASKSRKKSKQIVCPNCSEKLDILSTTEEEDNKSRNSPAGRNNGFSSPVDVKFNNNIPNDIDTCNHNPPCELVPVCQVLPIDNVYYNSKCTNKFGKHNQKSIRVTKACRHHPPCTVVPSCQRINVLNNNCEFIPPCLHRPRCVNLPLCVPFSKSLNYEDLLSKNVEEIDNSECSHAPRYKYFPGYQHDSLNNSIDEQFHTTQNTCEYVSEYTPRFILNPKLAGVVPTTFSPCKLPTPMPCHCCKSNKSCQYDCIDCKCTSSFKQKIKKSASSDAVIYIRDVGCQFRYKNFFPRDSLIRSKHSSASFELNNSKAANYYANFHTLRYEDKCTNPISGEELSMSTFTTSSLEIDVHCPSHGKQAKRKCNSGFSPMSTTSPFVAAFTTHSNKYYEKNEYNSKSNPRLRLNTYPTKSRRSFLQNKYKKVFSVRRRRKSRANHVPYSTSRRVPLNHKTL